MDTRHTREAYSHGAHFSSPAILFALGVTIFAGARLWQLTATCLWFDEIFSVHAARHSWPELFKFVAADIIHPPLFYAVLKLWISIGGESVLWLRLLPFIFAVATIAPFYFLCRELRIKSAERNLALPLMAVSGFLIKYAQEVRMYSLLLFLSVISIWIFARFLRNVTSPIQRVAALTVCNLLLVYTHYYGWLLVFAQACVVLIWHRQRVKLYLWTTAALIASYVPWIYAVLAFREPERGLAENIGWIARPGARDIGEYFVLLLKPFIFSQSTLDLADSFLLGWIALFLGGGAFAILIFRHGRARAFTEAETALLVLTFVPLILAFGLSWLLPFSIWGTRHLIFSSAPFFILVSIAIADLRPYWVKVAVAIGLSCVIFLAGAIYLLKPAPNLSWCAWDDLVKQASGSGESALVIYAFEDLVAYHVWFAGARQKQFEVRVLKRVPGVPEDPAFFLPRRFGEIKTRTFPDVDGEQIWVAFRAPELDEDRPPLSHLKALGYQTRTALSAQAQGEQAFLVELSRPR